MPNVLLLQGPNLNLLGTRETKLYGNTSMDELHNKLQSAAQDQGLNLICKQSNHEGDLIDAVQQAASQNIQFIIINPAGYTHTSVALRDALAAVDIPFIEAHISNIFARESYRKHSYFSDLAVGTIAGFGTQGYFFALQAAQSCLQQSPLSLVNEG